MFGLEILAKIFKILRSEDSPFQIAAGFCLGMLLGLTPLLTVHNLLVIILVIVIRVNLGSVLLAFALFSGLAYLFDPWFHALGYFLLVDVRALHSVWTFLYQFPLLALSHYNNTVVMGSLVFALLFFVPLLFFMQFFVGFYRRRIDPGLQKLKVVQLLKSTKFYSLYKKIESVRQ